MSALGFQGRAIISLPVSNLERSRRWYADMLGLQPERRLADPDGNALMLRECVDGVLPVGRKP